MRRRVRVFSTLACLCLPLSALAAEWPQFRGPRRDGKSDETGLLKRWPEGGPKLLWTAKGLGHGFASLAIAHGLIYTSGSVGRDTAITALDLAGKPAWTFANGPAWTGQHPGSRATPTIDGDRLYHQSPLGRVACLEARTGKKVWALDTVARFGARKGTWALGECLLVDGDRVIVSPGGRRAGVVALDKRTGKTVWVCPDTGQKAGYCSPILAEHDGLRQIVTMTAKTLVGIRAADGKLLWQLEHKTPFDENITQPLFHDGHVLFSTGHRVGSVLLKLNVTGATCTVTEVWRNRDLDNHHGCIILHDGHLYGTSHGKYKWGFASVDFRTGKTNYRVRTPTEGSLTFADGLLYSMDERGTVHLERPNPARRDIVSTFRIPRGGKARTWAHPVVCGARLYLRHSNFLFAYDIRAR